jgi:hypothetical protein
MNKTEDNKDNFKKPKINRENGLNVDYDRNELNKYLPHLMEEMQEQKKMLKIDSIDYDVESIEGETNENEINSNREELTDPTVIDFIRRCSNKEQAMEILDFLLNKEEISTEEYQKFKKKISKKNGLKDLIEECGGFKRPGYYLRKYYFKTKDLKREKNP